MTRLRQSELAAFSEALHRLYAVKDAAEFPRHLMEIVGDLLPARYISYDHIDLQKGVVVNIFDRPIPMSQEEFMGKWRTHCHEHPGIAHLEKGGEGKVFKITDFVSQRQFRQTGLYSELIRHFGIKDQLGFVMPVPGHIIGVAINRDGDFTDEETSLIELLHPHLAQAFSNAQLFSALQGREAIGDFTPWRRQGFTPRECEVLRWLTEGKRNNEIATILGISPYTVKTHVEHILARLGVETRTEAAAVARRMLGGSAA